jgi:hypothetical protein
MTNTRRVAAVLTATVAAVLSGAVPASASVSGPMPVTTWTSTIRPDHPTWIAIFWATNTKVCDVEVTVAAKDIEVYYPANTDTFTSFSQSNRLKPKRVDFTAVRLQANYRESAFVPLATTIAYNTCGKHPTDQSDTFELTVPVLTSDAGAY